MMSTTYPHPPGQGHCMMGLVANILVKVTDTLGLGLLAALGIVGYRSFCLSGRIGEFLSVLLSACCYGCFFLHQDDDQTPCHVLHCVVKKYCQSS